MLQARTGQRRRWDLTVECSRRMEGKEEANRGVCTFGTYPATQGISRESSESLETTDRPGKHGDLPNPPARSEEEKTERLLNETLERGLVERLKLLRLQEGKEDLQRPGG